MDVGTSTVFFCSDQNFIILMMVLPHQVSLVVQTSLYQLSQFSSVDTSVRRSVHRKTVRFVKFVLVLKCGFCKLMMQEVTSVFLKVELKDSKISCPVLAIWYGMN